jgi:hypothetical protein
MDSPYERHTLRTLKDEVEAWQAHIRKLRLEDRQRFVSWLSQAVTEQEFALIIDAEIDRQGLWETYLSEQYGC